MDRNDLCAALDEIARYFTGCYMNAAHGQAQVKYQRYIDAAHDAKKLISRKEGDENA